jgi:glucokinase
MPELNCFAIGEYLENRYGLPLLMENDAQAAALGEVWKGCLEGVTEAVVLTLGTGIGSGVIRNGMIWRANHSTGPELGHIYLGPGRKKVCGCGQVGCAETWLNKQALIDLFHKDGFQVFELRDILGLVQKQDPQVIRIIRQYGHRLGLYISMLQVVFGCDHIGLSGGMSHFVPFCLDTIWQTLRHRFVSRQQWLPKSIGYSPDPEMSGLYGMARLWELAEQGYNTQK